MTTEQKIIRAKVGVLELAKQLGNVSKACQLMGYSRDSFYRFKELADSRLTIFVEGGPLSPRVTTARYFPASLIASYRRLTSESAAH